LRPKRIRPLWKSVRTARIREFSHRVCQWKVCSRHTSGVLLPNLRASESEDPSSQSTGQCDLAPQSNGPNGPKCINSETESLKCLVPIYELGPCIDSSNTGCIESDAQCIKGYCDVPRGGQGVLCRPSGACKPGLTCVQSLLSGAGSCSAR
jgi:hypothetical protein